MLLINIYFSSALLLVALICPVVVSRSLPVMDKGEMNDSCVLHAGSLLRNITNAITQTNFSGINCTEQNVELNLETDTPSVCSPKDSTCSGNTKSSFDQESCLTNIGKDLTHYYDILSAQPHPDTFLDVLHSLKELMESCFKWSLPTESALKKDAVDPTYNERLSLCKVMRGFHVRTITINRAIGYINSGEHKK